MNEMSYLKIINMILILSIDIELNKISFDKWDKYLSEIVDNHSFLTIDIMHYNHIIHSFHSSHSNRLFAPLQLNFDSFMIDFYYI